MNWRHVFVYAAALFVAQVLIGFVEGVFAPGSVNTAASLRVVSSVASFLIGAGIFAHLGIRQLDRPVDHAWAALILQAVVSLAIMQVMAVWLSVTPPLLLAMDWAILIFALLFGTAIGRHIRLSRDRSADA